MSHPFDATLKELVAGFPDDYHGAFGMPKGEPTRLLNVDVSTVTAATDVALGFGELLREVVDLNFQSGPDRVLPARLLLYNVALHLRYGVPVRSLVVLLRPKANVKQLSGKLGYTSGRGRVEFEYEMIRLWRQPVEPFLQGGIGLLPLATLCELPKGEYVQEGEIRGKHQMLLKLGQKIFGRPEAETKAAVLSIRNPKRLDRLVVAALTASSWQELLSTQ
jgi:hypothetical protein